MDYDNRNQGVLFQNDKEGNEKRPDYTGKLDVEGVPFRIAGWKRVGKSGKPFLSLKISEPQEFDQQSGYEKAKAAAQQVKSKVDTVHEVEEESVNLDDIPF